MMTQKNWLIVGVIILAGILGGYWYGNSAGYAKGYKTAQDDIKKLEEDAGKKATVEAAKAANPFQVANPLQNVETNAFEKVKKVLNPF